MELESEELSVALRLCQGVGGGVLCGFVAVCVLLCCFLCSVGRLQRASVMLQLSAFFRLLGLGSSAICFAVRGCLSFVPAFCLASELRRFFIEFRGWQSVAFCNCAYLYSFSSVRVKCSLR